MLFASKMINGLETRVRELERANENLLKQWESEKLAITELQETASHMLSRIVMRNKRAMKAEAEATATEPSLALPAVDDVTLKILQRRGANAIPSNGG